MTESASDKTIDSTVENQTDSAIDKPVMSPVDKLAAQALESQIIEVIQTVYDPEIPVNIYELGLIYAVEVSANGIVDVKMTLTSPACPVAGTLPGEVENRVKSVDGVIQARVDIVWDPPWTPEMMSESAKLTLNMGP